MAGNAAEFVEDCFHGSYEGAPVDGGAHTTGCEQPPMPYPVGENEVFRIARGGSAGVPAVGIRTSARGPLNEATSSETVGFRCSRVADKP
jgi:formylglycine-generating enzyme required for sulfatase activity